MAMTQAESRRRMKAARRRRLAKLHGAGHTKEQVRKLLNISSELYERDMMFLTSRWRDKGEFAYFLDGQCAAVDSVIVEAREEWLKGKASGKPDPRLLNAITSAVKMRHQIVLGETGAAKDRGERDMSKGYAARLVDPKKKGEIEIEGFPRISGNGSNGNGHANGNGNGKTGT